MLRVLVMIWLRPNEEPLHWGERERESGMQVLYVIPELKFHNKPQFLPSYMVSLACSE
jgi:polyphosphate kinase